jgi:hypothetical protein
MRLLVDACVDVRVCNWLRERGHDALHLSEQGLDRLPDGDIFRKVVKASVILLRIGDPGWQRVVERLSSVLAASADAVAKGAVPLNAAFQPIVLTAKEEGDVVLAAEFVGRLR